MTSSPIKPKFTTSELRSIIREVPKEKRGDLSVHFIFVSLNILCFKRQFKIIKEKDRIFFILIYPFG